MKLNANEIQINKKNGENNAAFRIIGDTIRPDGGAASRSFACWLVGWLVASLNRTLVAQCLSFMVFYSRSKFT